MTSASSVSEEVPANPAPPVASPTTTPLRHLRAELLLALEIAGLCGLAFTRPILDSYGRSPETFLARDASRLDILLFVLVISLLPTVAIAGAAAATRVAGAGVRLWAQVGTIGLLGGVVAWRFGTDLADPPAILLFTAAAVVAAGLAVARWRLDATASFLRIMGAASVVFPLMFLAASPSSDLILRGSTSSGDPAMTAAVLDGTDGDPPPIVVVVVDAMPTSALLDGNGSIDPSLYPNLAAIADDATWYRNYTTMSAWTYQAVPSMLTGLMPGKQLPDTNAYPDNLFTLFAGTHNLEAVEQISRLCPTDACPRSDGSALSNLLSDAANWWRDGADPNRQEGQILPGALEPDRAEEFEQWIAAQDFARTGEGEDDQPGLWFYHTILPHEPWDLLPDGTRYSDTDDSIYGLFLHNAWTEVGAEVGLQRHLLQSLLVDRILGDLTDELKDAGIYDDALMVVVGDHGQAYTPGQPLRGVAEAQYEDVLWTPLIVKAPGQDTAEVDDTNVQSIDLMPILAETLGIDLPWETDGLPAAEAATGRDPGFKQVAASDQHELPADEDGEFITVDGVEGLRRVLESNVVEGEGEDAIWRRTPHGGLLGESIGDLVVSDQVVGTLEVERLDRILEPGRDGELTLELIGHIELPLDEVVAVAINGVIVAVAPTSTPPSFSLDNGELELQEAVEGETVVHALLQPGPFTDDNDMTAYVVRGEPQEPTLDPLTIDAG